MLSTHAERRAAKVLLEAAQHERALQLFAHAARNDRDEREHRGLARRRGELLERIVRDVVQRRREQANACSAGCRPSMNTTGTVSQTQPALHEATVAGAEPESHAPSRRGRASTTSS